MRADTSITLFGWDPRLPDRDDTVINTSGVRLDTAVGDILDAQHRSEP